MSVGYCALSAVLVSLTQCAILPSGNRLHIWSAKQVHVTAHNSQRTLDILGAREGTELLTSFHPDANELGTYA
jgi:hypothetical protein